MPQTTGRVFMALLAMSLCVGLLPDGASAGEAPAEKLDCRVYDKKTSKIGLGLMVAGFLFKAGPEISYSAQQGVTWDRTVQSFIVRYVELCERYNAGLVTKSEYGQRLSQMEDIYKEAQQVESKLYEATRTRAKESSSELDELVGRKKPSALDSATQASVLDDSINRLAGRIEQLEPIGNQLKPARPCPSPDMLGAPGAYQDADRRC
ncbi:MAG: hypothetical protein NTX84_04590 [Nitrospirae bacterium]|nr:hypothetical protein [Nitrospirota bacterium]